VSDVVQAGGNVIVSPNVNLAVGVRALELSVKWCPGVQHPAKLLLHWI